MNAMNIMKIVGICLIILGGIALLYHGVAYIMPKDVMDLMSFTINVRENEIIPLPPIIGGVSVAMGVAFFMLSGKKKVISKNISQI